MDLHSSTFILCETRFASNLGSSARVLKNFGFQDLCLVSPQCSIGAEARTFAMKGAELLDRARVFPSLEQSRQQIDFLIGTSARSKRQTPRSVPLHSVAQEILLPHPGRRFGIVFGSEKNGLSQEQMALCDWNVFIPSSLEYGSINLAQAVAIVACEIHAALSKLRLAPDDRQEPVLTDGQWKELMASLQTLLLGLDLPPVLSVRKIMKRLSQIAARAQLNKQDADLLLGLFKRIRGR